MQLLEAKMYGPMDRCWAYATAIVNINQDKKQYVTSDVKEMDKTRLLKLVGENEQKTAKHVMHGQAELARRIGIPQQTIGLYLKLLDLSPKVQKKIKDLGVAIASNRLIFPSYYRLLLYYFPLFKILIK